MKWFIKINSVEQGPYTQEQLKGHPNITPDTLARYEESNKWFPIGQFEELKELFKDDTTEIEEDHEENDSFAIDSELVLEQDFSPFHFFIWLLIILLVFTYFYFQITLYS